MQDVEQAIRERAYDLWIREGRQDGSAEAHWLTAQREILACTLENLGSVSATAKSKKRKKTSAKKAA